MFESLNWSSQDVGITKGDFRFTILIIFIRNGFNQFPSFSLVVFQVFLVAKHLNVGHAQIFPLLHELALLWAVYEFSKVEKKIVANQQNSCKGSQCNRVDPVTNPLNSGVTL